VPSGPHYSYNFHFHIHNGKKHFPKRKRTYKFDITVEWSKYELQSMCYNTFIKGLKAHKVNLHIQNIMADVQRLIDNDRRMQTWLMNNLCKKYELPLLDAIKMSRDDACAKFVDIQQNLINSTERFLEQMNCVHPLRRLNRVVLT